MCDRLLDFLVLFFHWVTDPSIQSSSAVPCDSRFLHSLNSDTGNDEEKPNEKNTLIFFTSCSLGKICIYSGCDLFAGFLGSSDLAILGFGSSVWRPSKSNGV